MSAGGQNGTALSGVTSMNIRNVSDVTAQRKLKLMYQNFSAATGTAYANRTPNGNDYYSQFLAGAKECGGSACQSGGLPYTRTLKMTFKNS
jgi:hypothetical protein